MNKVIDNYILNLKRNLSVLPESELPDVVEFYQEFLLDSNFQSEQEIVAKLGTPKQLARKILADYAISDNSKEKEKMQAVSPKSDLKTIWIILLGVLAAPVGIPLAIVAFVVMGLALVALIAVVLALVLFTIALFVLGIFVLVKSFGLIFSTYWATGFFYVGACICLICISLLIAPVIVKLIWFLITECATFFKYLGRKIFKGRYYKTNSQRKAGE